MSQHFKIASPCPASWDRMEGDDKSRYCSECNLYVYNFAAMTSAEIEELTASHTGRLCGRLYRRSDGTVLTKDCPVGARIIVKRRSYLAGAALSVALSLGPAAAAQTPKSSPNSNQKQQEQNDGQISIVVEDQSGAVIPKATVILLNRGRDSKLTVVTDELGRAQFSHLRAANYLVSVTANGFETASKPLLLLEHQKRSARVAMDISSAVQGWVVSAEPSVPDTEPLSSRWTPLDLMAPPDTQKKESKQHPKD